MKNYMIDFNKLCWFIRRYIARCKVVKNPGYEAAIATCNDIFKHGERLYRNSQNGEADELSHNKQSTKCCNNCGLASYPECPFHNSTAISVCKWDNSLNYCNHFVHS